jgi:hypothetical protein
VVPPFKLQSLIVMLVKVFPVDRATSKYSPEELNDGAPAGFDPYCATVTAPSPVAVTDVPALVAEAVPPGVVETPLAELTDPGGAAGGVSDSGVACTSADGRELAMMVATTTK